MQQVTLRPISDIQGLKETTRYKTIKQVIIKDKGTRSMSPGSLSFAKLAMMSCAPANSAGDARYASQDPFIQSTLSHTISTPICIRSAFFLRRTQ